VYLQIEKYVSIIYWYNYIFNKYSICSIM